MLLPVTQGLTTTLRELLHGNTNSMLEQGENWFPNSLGGCFFLGVMVLWEGQQAQQ